MHWVYLMLAIVFEVIGTTMMRMAHGFTRLTPSILLFVFYGVSFALMTVAIKKIDMSVSYAIWSGLGTALIAVIGYVWFREPATAAKIASITLILIGVVGLQFGRTTH
jgi:small multidrug resistance pump